MGFYHLTASNTHLCSDETGRMIQERNVFENVGNGLEMYRQNISKNIAISSLFY